MFSAVDCTYMAHALRLAEQGLYTTTPNPRVGCVIVNHQKIVGEGAHLKAGEPHAEVHALRQAAGMALGANIKGADIYVTLEPCSHIGKTPPCVNAVIEAQPQRVIIAMQDPNPLVAGRGIAALREAGIEVLLGVLEAEANALNIGFVSRMTRGTPYVRSKIAASLDGKTALENGQSQWITSAPARLDVQHWRAQSCAIISGIGTVLADDPSLTVRLPQTTRQPLKVIVDSRLQTPVTAKLLQEGPVLIAYANDVNQQAEQLSASGAQLLHCPNAMGQIDLNALLLALGQRGVNEVLLEAGQALNGAFLQAGLVDEWLIYYAPKLLGGNAKSIFAMPLLTDMQQAIALKVLDVRQVGLDIRVRAKPVQPS
jgi:diaminohydroxyphosphoribosylaminopyrimidine deaminase/5-amino-6-(5-phosphoribosylamino)uracil reductase